MESAHTPFFVLVMDVLGDRIREGEEWEILFADDCRIRGRATGEGVTVTARVTKRVPEGVCTKVRSISQQQGRRRQYTG